MIFEENTVIIGLTGMSGAGKTTACEAFRECGFAVINCDLTARTVTERGRPALREIALRFGDCLLPDGELDRRKLGSVVFSSETERLALNKIIYPYIAYEIILEIISYIERGERYILLDAPTLFESGIDGICDKVVSITADMETCVSRITARDGLTPEQARQRLSSQFSEEIYQSRSDHCLKNNGTAEELRKRVSEIAGLIYCSLLQTT